MLLSLAVAAAVTFASPAGTPGDSTDTAARLRPTEASVALTTLLPSAPAPVGVPLGNPARLHSGPVRSGPDEDASTPQIIEYSDGYFTRLTIHRWASYLTLPLFAGQYIVGQKLIDGEGSGSLRSLHGALAGSVAALFAVNTVTGGLNLIEGWQDPVGRKRRLLHSALMILADAGFVATGALANESEHGGNPDNSAHKNMALASMGTALVSYAIMLPIFGH